MKRTLIFSAINVTSGGPLTILQRFMEFAADHLAAEYEVWFLIRDRKYLSKAFPRIHLMEFKRAQSTVVHKLLYEYWYFRKISKQKKPYLWFSLNDCSPSVEAPVRAVYIHNATIFYQITFMDLRFPSRVILQRFYYWFFLRINLHKNTFVVVQQKFMKEHIAKRLGFPRADDVLINRPTFSVNSEMVVPVEGEATKGSSVLLIYPTKAEVYKNVHRLTEAAITLIEDRDFTDFTLWLTLKGDENRYSRYLAKTTEAYPQIVFRGSLSFPVLMGHVQASDILVFPSKLETWGLPLSEAIHFDKWIVAADLPYAHETLAGYAKVVYFDPDSSDDLAQKILDVVDKVRSPAPALQHEETVSETEYLLPALFEQILSGKIAD